MNRRWTELRQSKLREIIQALLARTGRAQADDAWSEPVEIKLLREFDASWITLREVAVS
jgi:hypothetical protein